MRDPISWRPKDRRAYEKKRVLNATKKGRHTAEKNGRHNDLSSRRLRSARDLAPLSLSRPHPDAPFFRTQSDFASPTLKARRANWKERRDNKPGVNW